MKHVISWLVIIAVVAGGVVTVKLWHQPPAVLPPTITNQLSFKAYVPTGGYSIRPGSVSYDGKQALLTFSLQKLSRSPVVVTEQPYPDTLIYDKLIGTMSAVREVGNSLGKATVTHPKSAPGKEVTVVQADTTLMFISSDSQLNDDQWRAILNSFVSVK